MADGYVEVVLIDQARLAVGPIAADGEIVLCEIAVAGFGVSQAAVSVCVCVQPHPPPVPARWRPQRRPLIVR